MILVNEEKEDNNIAKKMKIREIMYKKKGEDEGRQRR